MIIILRENLELKFLKHPPAYYSHLLFLSEYPDHGNLSTITNLYETSRSTRYQKTK